ncbi:Uncharacterised protein [Candidatus Gugararchaeum adminiculabundum]|nr:Uncharacterised protein [Candidatus Gugararchaeum adminiculabundum]
MVYIPRGAGIKSNGKPATPTVLKSQEFWLNAPIIRPDSPFIAGKGSTVPGPAALEIASGLTGNKKEKAEKAALEVWKRLGLTDFEVKPDGEALVAARSAEEMLGQKTIVTDMRFWCTDFSRMMMAVALAAGIPARLSMNISSMGRLHLDAEVFLEKNWFAVNPEMKARDMSVLVLPEMQPIRSTPSRKKIKKVYDIVEFVLKGADLPDFGINNILTFKRFNNWGKKESPELTKEQAYELMQLQRNLKREYQQWLAAT